MDKSLTLANPALLVDRVAMLGEPHIAPLDAWRTSLASPDRRFPHFDPLDGGVRAKLLMLMETPGPDDSPVRFVSRDNRTGTAANLRRFFTQAGIAREDTLLWNAVPWIIHAPAARNRAPKPAEIREGLTLLPPLLALLPNLRVIILAGKPAAGAERVIRSFAPHLPILMMPHPSPVYVNTNPEISKRIVRTLHHAATILENNASESPDSCP